MRDILLKAFVKSTEYLGNKPQVGAATGFTGFTTSVFFQNAILVLQLLVLIASLTVSVLTIIGWVQKRRK